MKFHFHTGAAALVALTLLNCRCTSGEGVQAAAPGPSQAERSAGVATAQTISPPNTAGMDRAQLEGLGDLYVVRRRYLDAIAVYQQAAGDSAVVWNKLGIAYQHIFNNTAARLSYERSLRLDPKYAEALNNMGTILYSEKNYRAATKYYTKALKISPHSAAVFANLGAAQFAKGDYKHGVKSYREAFTIDSTVFEGQSANKIEEYGSREAQAMLDFHLARFYAAARMNGRALECLRQALDNGFTDRKKLMGDEELAELRETPEFRKLLAEQGLH